MVMRCVICKHGETQPGAATVLLERGTLTLVVKHVPAEVCANCGERYFDETAPTRLLAVVEQAVDAGVQVDIRDYVAA
jgi:YgiT-type zinc finger domain-containing protein